MCSGSKTKLLVVGTREMRKTNLLDKNKVNEINVSGHRVTESQSERLLGLLINHRMTCENHLYGTTKTKG